MRIAVTVFCLLGIGFMSNAQEYRFDVGIKAFASHVMEGKSTSFDLYGVRFDSRYLLNKNISVGLSYTHSDFNEKEVLVSDGDLQGSMRIKPRWQSFGLTLQAGTSRYKRIRLYGVLDGFYTEQVLDVDPTAEHGGAFTLASSGWGVGLGLGLSIKLSRVFSFNLFEARANYYPSSFNLIDDDPVYQFEVQSGCVFRMFRKK